MFKFKETVKILIKFPPVLSALENFMLRWGLGVFEENLQALVAGG